MLLWRNCGILILLFDGTLVLKSYGQLPRRLVGIDRAQVVEALGTLGLEGVVQEHGIMLGVADWNPVGSPEAMHVKEAVLEHLWHGRVQRPADPAPCVRLGLR